MDDLNDFRSWAQGFKCNEQLKFIVDMNDSKSWAQSFRCYEQLGAVNDMNDFGLRP